MKIEKDLIVDFNGSLFEKDHNCIVYILNDKLVFVFDKTPNNLDDLIAENVNKSKLLIDNKSAAITKLAALGLTEDEAKAVIGS
jgi:hypothetical protein